MKITELSIQWQDMDPLSTLGDVADAIKPDVYVGTTAEWRSQPGFQPERGALVMWLDKSVVVSADPETSSDVSVDIPGLKVGNGNAYNLDLPFIADDIAIELMKHICSPVHLSGNEREVWNHKITVGDINDPTDDGVRDEILTLTRN